MAKPYTRIRRLTAWASPRASVVAERSMVHELTGRQHLYFLMIVAFLMESRFGKLASRNLFPCDWILSCCLLGASP